jgi:hypothetical protein
MAYQLHLGIGGDLEQNLRAYATARGITIAAAVRILLHEALNEKQGGRLDRLFLAYDADLDDRVGGAVVVRLEADGLGNYVR